MFCSKTNQSGAGIVIAIYSVFFCVVLLMSGDIQAQQQASDDVNEEVDEIVTLGTRRKPRSVVDSAVPVDVIGKDELLSEGFSDINTLLRTHIPSYNVNTQAIQDAATLVRPTNLRGLPSDSTLVLVNGKRRHRSGVIALLGGGINDGAQGADTSVIPGIALKQVEVLRDGAAAQYGSDAIAGVINYVLRDDNQGASIETRWGEYSYGDGTLTQISANLAMPFTNDGFANISFQLKNSDPTIRSVQRDDAIALTAAGNTGVANPAQIWGSPEVKDDFTLFANIGLDLSENQAFYLFGNWAEREVDGGFFYRNPNTRSGVFSGDGGATLLVGDLTAGVDDDGIDCPVIAVLDNVPDVAALAAVTADPNCFVFNELFPGGFTPRFGGKVVDTSLHAGVKGELDNGLTYDLSFSIGRNGADFVIRNTVNSSLGPNTPTRFTPGSHIQTDRSFNVDFTYPVATELFASDLNIAFGFESRKETFQIVAGDQASFEPGPLFTQGFSVGSNGFQGFSPKDAGKFDRSNIALYVDLEADITDNWLLGLAIRGEDFSDFGTTTNGKLSTRLQLTDDFALRAAVSSGFRAPTVGQSNIRNSNTNFGGGQLSEELIIPPTSTIGMQKGGRALEPEESDNLSLGVIFDNDDLSVTIDYFSIEVINRIALTGPQTISDIDRAALLAAGVFEAATVSSVRFFTNDFDTTTKGIDIVLNYPLNLFSGETDLSFAYNRTDTTVDRRSDIISDARVRQLEDSLPQTRWTATATQSIGEWSGFLRLSYYDEFFEDHLDANGVFPIEAGDSILVDAEISFAFADGFKLSIGGQNITDEYPDENPFAGVVGAKYPVISPYGFNGAFYYGRLSYEF